MEEFALDSIREQVDAVLSEISRMEGLEFPYQHTEDGLKVFRVLFETHQSNLLDASSCQNATTKALACAAANTEISSSIDVLGFLLRSTNIRNAFEAYGPILRLSRKILGDSTKLIISSEWRFTPFTYINFSHLSGYVLIGLPAPESSNPFLLPLAGHELGHTLWRNYFISRSIGRSIEDKLISEIQARWKSDFASYFNGISETDIGSNLFAISQWRPALTWALKQCEEYFCDFIGLRIFGKAYLYAFAYLLSPQQAKRSNGNYPALHLRAQCLVDAASKYSVEIDPSYLSWFEKAQNSESLGERQNLIDVADSVSLSFVQQLIDNADTIISTAKLPTSNRLDIDKIKARFNLHVPAENTGDLVAILNAGWESWIEKGYQQSGNKGNSDRENLKEIVLKTIEILEIEERLKLQ